MLDEVVRWAGQELGKPSVDGINPRYEIDDWLNLHVALREAEALIRGTPSAGGKMTGGGAEGTSPAGAK